MHPPTQALPKHAADDIAIAQLTDLYQQQLAELNACHSLLLADQERLAGLLAPHMTPSGQVSPEALQQLDPMILVFKEGLDLRLNEFQEDCRRIQATERRLQRKIEKAAAEYESNFLATSADFCNSAAHVPAKASGPTASAPSAMPTFWDVFEVLATVAAARNTSRDEGSVVAEVFLSLATFFCAGGLAVAFVTTQP